ncbi:FHA domain-containing protein [bacterium]|nr:FHA domain-containing protein [candidate division CSSED10-310 bacterium]
MITATGNNQSASRVEFCSSEGFRQEYILGKTRVLIGAQAEADIAFPGLVFEHAELTHEEGEWVIRQRNPDATIQFRGYPIQLKKLNPGDRIFLGSGTLTFLGQGDQEITAVTAMSKIAYPFDQFELLVLNGPERGRMIAMEPGEYILGRAEQKHAYTTNNRRIEFDHKYVSRTHVRLYVDNCRVRVQDMLSTNGTRINRHFIKTGEIRPGDTLHLGKLKLRLIGPETYAAEHTPTIRIRLKDTTLRKYGLWLGLMYAAILTIAFFLARWYFF